MRRRLEEAAPVPWKEGADVETLDWICSMPRRPALRRSWRHSVRYFRQIGDAGRLDSRARPRPIRTLMEFKLS